MRASTLGMTICSAVLLTALASAPASAGVDVDLGAAVRIGDNTDLYFAISSRYFDRDRREVETWGRRYQHPDDLAVALFIARRSGRSPDFLFSLRRGGLAWWEIGLRVGLPVDAWFVPVERDPGPPYGKAYGHWKKHGKKGKKGSRPGFELSDNDLRNLVSVRVLHEYYGVSVEAAMEWRASGRELPVLLSEEYDRRHGKKGTPPGHAKKKSKAPAQGKSKGKAGH